MTVTATGLENGVAGWRPASGFRRQRTWPHRRREPHNAESNGRVRSRGERDCVLNSDVDGEQDERDGDDAQRAASRSASRRGAARRPPPRRSRRASPRQPGECHRASRDGGREHHHSRDVQMSVRIPASALAAAALVIAAREVVVTADQGSCQLVSGRVPASRTLPTHPARSSLFSSRSSHRRFRSPRRRRPDDP